LIPAEEWRPIGISDLEPAAWKALRDNGNAAVVAGPGAGKTEFLAQRAAYLLQTGICPWPQRILAISFKKDAAANLGRRVASRVPEHAGRFASMTFDAFTKSLVDRFAAALPADWRMSDGYHIRYTTDSEVSQFLNGVAFSAPPALSGRLGFQPRRFVPDVVGGWQLPESLPPEDEVDAVSYAVREWWRARYLRSGTAEVDFVMLNRLAELLVRAVPKLRRALRMTYPMVFVDEFQDTTSAQFSFLTSVFGEETTVTAVGDSKQRIMGWAGALPEALQRFTDAFDATSYALAWNFRSSDALVELQHVIASKLARPRYGPPLRRPPKSGTSQQSCGRSPTATGRRPSSPTGSPGTSPPRTVRPRISRSSLGRRSKTSSRCSGPASLPTASESATMTPGSAR
jgi:superfamily I DNA/RNA helicase